MLFPLRSAARRRLRWLLPQSDDTQDTGLYLAVILLQSMIFTIVVSCVCFSVEASVPGYLCLSHSVVLGLLLYSLPKCRTDKQISAVVYAFLAAIVVASSVWALLVRY